MKVLIPQDITDAGKKYLRDRGYEVIVGSGYDITTICHEVADCDALLVRTAPYTKEIMDAGKKLKVIARHGVGVDNIDIEAATAHGIWVVNSPLSNCNAVAEHTIAFLLACANNLVHFDKQAKSGNWDERNRLKNIEVEGKVLGLIGIGRIGRSVAEKAALGLGMKVIGYDAYVDRSTLPNYIEAVDNKQEVYVRSDFVSIHVPVTPETQKSVNKQCFAQMKKSAYLLNCARGEVIDEADLNEALEKGDIAGAAVDVLCSEPPDQDNPLLKQERLIISPHNAAHTYEAMDNMGLHAAIGIDEVLSGKKPRWPVNCIK